MNKALGHYVEPVDPNALGVLDTRYDSRVIDGASNEVRFFPQNPSQDVLVQNYTNQPFDGERDYFIVGLGLEARMPSIHAKTADSVNAQHIVNVLSQSVVELKTDNDRTTLFSVPMPIIFDFKNVRPYVARTVDTDGAGAVTLDEHTGVSFGFQPLANFWQPFLIKANTPFHLRVHLPSAGATLINAMNFSNQPGGFGLTALMQFAKASA